MLNDSHGSSLDFAFFNAPNHCPFGTDVVFFSAVLGMYAFDHNSKTSLTRKQILHS